MKPIQFFEDFFQITPEANVKAETNVKVETKVNVADALQSVRNLKCKKCNQFPGPSVTFSQGGAKLPLASPEFQNEG